LRGRFRRRGPKNYVSPDERNLRGH
jgi:hypothetical protein